MSPCHHVRNIIIYKMSYYNIGAIQPARCLRVKLIDEIGRNNKNSNAYIMFNIKLYIFNSNKTL